MTPGLFAGITDPLPEPMLLVTGDGRIAGLNRAAARLFGSSAAELLHRSLFELVATPAHTMQQYLRECARTSQFIPGALALGTGEQGTIVYRCDGAHVRATGTGAVEPAHVLLRLRPRASAQSEFLLLNAKLAELHKEIAERRRAEAQLAALNRCFLGFTRDFDRNIERLVTVCGTLLGAAWVAYERLAGDALVPKAVWNAPDADAASGMYKPDGRLCEQILRQPGQTLVVWRASPDDPYARTDPAVARHGVVTYMGKAVFQAEQCAGVLSVYFQDDVPVKESERRVLEIVASAIGIEKDRRAAELSLRRHADELRAMRDDLAEQAAELRAKGEELELARAAAESANKAKDAFLATMSHEIRTPMNAILGFIELLMATELTAEQLDYGRTIQSGADALLRIVDDILDFSKLEAGKLLFESIDFALRAFLNEVHDLFAQQAAHKGLALCLDLDPELPAELRGDPMRLCQVLANLVSNAVKFTHEGRVVILARLESQDKDHVVVRFAVKDTGIGIAAQAREHLFESFTQADTSTTRQYGGTGLGLAICKRLVELMDGAIGVESEPGQGSEFWFTARFARPALAAPVGKPDTIDHKLFKGLRILVVEDNSVNQKLISAQLAQLGCAAAIAGNGRIALEMLAMNTYDVILMDCEMPEVDGYEATRRIRGADSPAGLSRIPIIALTAHALEGAETRCLAVGMDDYVAKPVSLIRLKNALLRRVPSHARLAAEAVESTGTPGSGR